MAGTTPADGQRGSRDRASRGRMVIGVAGPYCAGKNTVAAILERRGYAVIDVDGLGHQALRDQRDAVVAAFGPQVLDQGGEIDRRRLAELVFTHRRQLARLEALVHPAMCARVDELMRRLGARVVINAAILFRMGLHTRCDLVICVRAPLLVRMRRARRRDGVGVFGFLRRVRLQRGICPNPRTRTVDTCTVRTVRNTGSLSGVEARVLQAIAGERHERHR